MIKYHHTIRCPVVTEKASFLKEKFNKYSLYVFVNVNKHKVRSAIESLFNVRVSSINVIRVKSKHRRFRGVAGYEKQKKKVYFSLVDGQKLDIMEI